MTTGAMVAQHHCAKFSPSIIGRLASIVELVRPSCILDPYLGVGGLRFVADQAEYRGPIVGVEIEPEFADAARQAFAERPSVWIDTADSAVWEPGAFTLPWLAREPVLVCTSPDYGNRFADQYLGTSTEQALRATLGTLPKRMSYAISLGRPVTTGAGTKHRFGKTYKSIHESVAHNITGHLRNGAYWALNVSDFVRAGKPVHVTDWWVQMLAGLSWRVVAWHRVDTPRMGHGANSDARAADESVILFRLAVPRGEG